MWESKLTLCLATASSNHKLHQWWRTSLTSKWDLVCPQTSSKIWSWLQIKSRNKFAVAPGHHLNLLRWLHSRRFLTSPSIRAISKMGTGFMANGVPIYSGYSEPSQYDALLASSQSLNGGATNLDMCLGSLTNFGLYKYHSFSPCIWPSGFKASISIPTSCNSNTSCKANAFSYSTSKIGDSSQSQLKVIGIAKDGH